MAEPDILLHPERKVELDKYGTICAVSYYGDSDCVAYHVQYLETEKENLMKEIESVKNLGLNHGQIVSFFEIKNDVPNWTNSIFFIMEKFVSPMNSYLQRNNEFVNDPQFLFVKVCMLQNILCALRFLHERHRIVHSDLSTGAVFLYGDRKAKVAYFGKMKNFVKSSRLFTTLEDICHWPPEAFIKPLEMTKKYDIFSFGCIAIEMITHTKPIPDIEFLRKTPVGGYNIISEIERRNVYLKKLKELNLGKLPEVIGSCLQNNPVERPETSSLCNEIQKCKDALSEGQKSIKQQNKQWRRQKEKILKERHVEKESECSCSLLL